MNEREPLVDCLRRLNRAEVTYYLTGSMASNYWGIPRTTHNLDFVIQLQSRPRHASSEKHVTAKWVAELRGCFGAINFERFRAAGAKMKSRTQPPGELYCELSIRISRTTHNRG